MAIPREIECHLVEDLIIPFVAGETSPETSAWVTEHVSHCERCQSALRAASDGENPFPEPTPVGDEPGRRLMKRVRRSVWLTVGLLAVLVVAVVGLSARVRTLANMPAEHPVPAASVAPEEAVRLNLTDLGLTSAAVAITTEPADGATASYQDPTGQMIKITAYRFPTAGDARTFAKGWERSFATKMLSLSTNLPSHSATKFRSEGVYYYAWREGIWFMQIAVPETVASPAALRDHVRDRIIEQMAR